MDLKIHEAARLLKVDGDEVEGWIREKGLPAHWFNDQFHVNSVELQEWALANGVKLPPELVSVNRASAGAAADLVAALERGGLHRDVAGATRDEVLASVIRLPGVPGPIDRELLLELLRAREMLASTGLGGGIAVPHPRSPIVLDVQVEPTLLLCFLRQPVDFGAVDGRPVGVLFLLLSPTVPDHLRLLSQLSYALHDGPLRSLLDQRAPLEALVARLAELRAATPQAGK
jgi:PTS system nitrogen regulatory IIA component